MNDQSTSPRDAHTALSAPQLRPGGLKYQVSSDKKDESRINERTLEKWEQGRAKPNPQAAALVLLVRRYPDTLARLDEVAAR
jgi:hypothetical protein